VTAALALQQSAGALHQSTHMTSLGLGADRRQTNNAAAAAAAVAAGVAQQCAA
jgi:hypothetical protein